MTPKFDTLLGQLREGDAATGATASVGDISYFAADPSAGWLKCDGKVYLRSAYLSYEAQRPDPAFVATLILDDDTWTGWAYYYVQRTATESLSNDCSYKFSTVTETFTEVNPTGSPSTHYATQLTVTPAGTLYAVPVQSRNVHKSTDGVAWTVATNALPEAQVDFAPLELSRACTPSGRFYLPFQNTFKFAWSDDGVTFTLADVSGDFQGALAELRGIPRRVGSVVAGFRPSGNPEAVRVLESTYVTDLTLSTYYYSLVAYPGTVAIYGLEEEAGEIYTRTAIGIYRGEDQAKGEVPSTVKFGNMVPIGTAGKLLFTDALGGYLVDQIGWLSPDASQLEHADVTEVFPAAFIPEGSGARGFLVARTATASYLRGSDAGFNNFQVWKVTTDPTRFHAPGLSPVAGAWPYVYVGD